MNGGTLRVPAPSPLLSQKNISYSLHKLSEPKYLSVGWVVAAMCMGKAILKYLVF